ncbi:MAG: hypothetical protein EXR75_05175 [Myxococcales bacterium]|nr:hypothetical protein [Myxococcales bacterium]
MIRSSVLCLLATVAVAGCKTTEEETEAPAKSATATTTTVVPVAPSTAVAPPTATVAQIVPDTGSPTGGSGSVAKTELDGRAPDAGHAGATISITGSKATFVVPGGWTTKPGEYSVSTAADGKARFAATAYKDGEAPATKLGAAATALGLTDCAWGTADSISLGKDKLPASAADGTCKRDGNPVKAVYAATSGKDMHVLAVSAWDEGSDNKGALNTLRSCKGATGGTGDPTGIGACCSALKQNAASAPITQKGAYLAAAGLCQSLVSNPQGKAALSGVRAMLAGAGVPPACR